MIIKVVQYGSQMNKKKDSMINLLILNFNNKAYVAIGSG